MVRILIPKVEVARKFAVSKPRVLVRSVEALALRAFFVYHALQNSEAFLKCVSTFRHLCGNLFQPN